MERGLEDGSGGEDIEKTNLVRKVRKKGTSWGRARIHSAIREGSRGKRGSNLEPNLLLLGIELLLEKKETKGKWGNHRGKVRKKNVGAEAIKGGRRCEELGG